MVSEFWTGRCFRKEEEMRVGDDFWGLRRREEVVR